MDVMRRKEIHGTVRSFDATAYIKKPAKWGRHEQHGLFLDLAIFYLPRPMYDSTCFDHDPTWGDGGRNTKLLKPQCVHGISQTEREHVWK